MRGRLGRAARDGRPADPAVPYRTPRAYDLLDAPASAGHRVLVQWERLGFPLGPVLAVPAVRVEVAGSAGSVGSMGSVGSAGSAGWATPAGRRDRSESPAVPGRLQFFVAAGTAASLAADLADLGWTPEELDLRAVSGVVAAETVLPPPDSRRWVRAPEAGRAASYPPAQMLLGSLAYACRRRLVGRIGGGPRR